MSHVITSVNVAIGKPATQSSLSEWSTENDASGAVSGVMPKSFGFHTDHEMAPWWMVDLQELYPIDRIVIHNRLDMRQERAHTCRVEISEDGSNWLLVHAGHVHFSGGAAGPPLVLPLGGRVTARFVRISLEEVNFLHLAQVEVFGNIGVDLRRQTGLTLVQWRGDMSTPDSVHTNWIGKAYWLETASPQTSRLPLIGLKLTFIGRLGNQIIQLTQAIGIARRLGLKYIVVLQTGMIRLAEKFSHDGLEFVSDIADVAKQGAFLTGNFFFRDELSPVLDQVSHRERYQIVHDIIVPRLMDPLPDIADVKYDDELTIHLRSGDIFQNSPTGYTQPPLAFYTVLIRRLIAERRVRRVRLVFENRFNPCIDPLIVFLESEGIPYRIQNGTLVEDLVSLIDSPFLVFGFGSFGIGVCLMSRRVDTVYCFKGMNDTEYVEIPSVGRVVVVRDREERYTKPGEWTNSREQRLLMLEYPESALEFVE